MSVTACIGEPVSWLALERFHLGELDGARRVQVSSHLEACPACRGCLDTIERAPATALPPLPALDGDDLARARARRRRVLWAASAAGALAAAALLLLVVRPKEGGEAPSGTTLKGGAPLTVSLVRERAGEVQPDATGFRAGDRFKVLVTCAAPEPVRLEVVVEQGGESFRPLAPAEIRCGNRVVLPGAFALDGAAPARVCATAPALGAPACVPLAPE